MLIQRDNYLSFEPNRIVTYKRFLKFNPPRDLTEAQVETLVKEGIEGNLQLAGEPVKREKDARDENLIRSNLYNGWLNPAAARCMRNVLMNWTQAIELHSSRQAVTEEKIFPILLTLTLPGTQFISDYDAKLCLEKFIANLNREELTRYMAERREIMRYARKEERERLLREALSIHQRAVRKYLWRAEPQKSGNIHFHLVVDQWIDKDEARARWNSAIEEVGGCITLYQNAQRNHYRIIHTVRNNPETVWAHSPEQWIPGKPFVYAGYRFRVDEDQKKQKMTSIRQRINKAIELRKVPYLIEEGEVLLPLLKEAIQSGKCPKLPVIARAAEELQLRAFCRAVDADFSNPPTTRIESMRNKASVAAYLAKYLSKPTVEMKTEKIDLEAEAKKPGSEWIGDKLFDDQEEEVKAETVTIVTTGRRIRGRIWGKSRELLTVKDFGFFKISESSFTNYSGMVDMGTEERQRKVIRKVPAPTLFGVMEYEDRIETVTETRQVNEYVQASGRRITTAALPYYEAVRAFVGEENYWQDTDHDNDRPPNVTIVKLNRRVTGTGAPADMPSLPDTEPTPGKKPVVIRFNQSQLLGKFAPELRQAYDAHYHDLFYTIYNSPHHVTPGNEPPAHAEHLPERRHHSRPSGTVSYSVNR